MRAAFLWASEDSNTSSPVQLRVAAAEDATTILGLVQELATFEREPDAVTTTAADLVRDGFGETPLFHVFLASLPESPTVVGMAFCYLSYSTWTGPCMFLEDLYVSPSARRRGVSRTLFKALARAAWVTGCARLHWSVLKWNTPAIALYESPDVAAERLDEWGQYRLNRADIERVAQVPLAAAAPSASM
jgi:GNAT superfamily N-acetyltransferase